MRHHSQTDPVYTCNFHTQPLMSTPCTWVFRVKSVSVCVCLYVRVYRTDKQHSISCELGCGKLFKLHFCESCLKVFFSLETKVINGTYLHGKVLLKIDVFEVKYSLPWQPLNIHIFCKWDSHLHGPHHVHFWCTQNTGMI